MSSTSAHPPPSAPDATTQRAPRRQPAAAPPSAAELADAQIKLKSSLRQYPDFPTPGILFEDISPLFADPELHALLIDTIVGFISEVHGGPGTPDVIVGLDARGFYFAPSLALKFNAGFVPARKHGKLPGHTVQASYEKEYGKDVFEMQKDAIKPGQRVLIVDDIIATGGSAAAAGDLVEQCGGTLIGYVFMLELGFLKGRERLKAPVWTLLSGQEGDSK